MAGAEALERAIDFIEASLGEDIGVHDIAEAACLSSFHFARVFSAAFLIGPWEWLVRRRIGEAAKVLAAGSADVTEAAFAHGFSGSDVFSRAFRRVTGIPPVETKRTGERPRRILEAPPREVIRIAADPERRPRIDLSFFAGETLRGDTLFAAPVPTVDAAEAFRAAGFASVLSIGLRSPLRILASPPRPGFDALFVSSQEPGPREAVVPEGRYARCRFFHPEDVAVGRAWFIGVALASASFSAETTREIIAVDEDGISLRVPVVPG